MNLIRIFLLVTLFSVSLSSYADHLTKDAAIGGGIGGAVGGMVGAEVGGRNGAILGSAAGAAIGTVVTTKESQHRSYTNPPTPVPVSRKDWFQHNHKSYRHCPPGLAKKGRC